MLAVFALNVEAMQGAIYQMLNHGLSTGALFLCVGILYERAHTRMISDYGGVSKQMPVFSAFFLIAMLSSVGLPGLNGFIGEVLCLYGVFKTNQLWAILGITTIILAAGYLLWMFQRVMQGPITNQKILSFKDLSLREVLVFVPVVIMMFWMGIFPNMFLNKMDTSVSHLIEQVKNRTTYFAEQSERSPVPELAPGAGLSRDHKSQKDTDSQ
jgi:NADH-quinone oxidoreductase subunit M